ncbi:uncharacterized protein LOC118411781 [Branchiostoma floridae]|uniref:Uncharacterized protein LOC118411781 n=1 Tax=Branchiostoma floridae TaxID=7739 RepID=A0A9J7MK34_BRAFL|nr:uncharacterized protein LOC118411781 [Branchiostoma floridae]
MEEGLRGEEDALWRKLRDLPTLFQLNIPRMAEASFSKVITKLRTEKRQVPEEVDEDVRSENLLAFLLLYIDKIEEAKPHIDSVLNEADPNLVALGNICAYHLKMYDVTEAMNDLRTMESIIKVNDQVAENKKAIAIGEQGYCLSRLGPKCHQMAVEKFREALGCGPPDYKLKVKWNYGLALCLDRLLDRHAFVEDPKFKPTEVYEEAKRCLALVTGSDIQDFCGKGWVALGEVHSKYVKIDRKYFECNRKPEVLSNHQIDECFEKGLTVASDDHFVLERAGRHYRHRKRVDEAIKCLEKANIVRPSAFAWHHLGLAYRSKAPRGRTSHGSSPGWRGRSRQRGNQYWGASPENGAHCNWYQSSTPSRGGRGGRGRPGGRGRGMGRGRFDHGNINTSHHDVRQQVGRGRPWSPQVQWNPDGRNQTGLGGQSPEGADTIHGYKGYGTNVPLRYQNPARGGRGERARTRRRGYCGGQGSSQTRYDNDGASSLTHEVQSVENRTDDVDKVQRDLGRMTLASRDESEATGPEKRVFWILF